MDCIFCKIANGEIPSTKVYEDEKILAFKDLEPQAPVHILIIPKEHIKWALDITEKNSAVISHIFKKIPEIAKEQGLENGFRIIKESSATDGKRYYCIISAQYDGIKREAEEWYTYVGELIRNRDEVSQMYINKTVAALEKKLEAMKNAGVDEALVLADTVAELKQKITEENNG